MNYSVAPKFVPAKLKYSGVLLESYFSIFHIAHRACLDYTLINLYSLYIAVSGEYFANTIIVRQIFLVPAHLYGFAFLLFYLAFYYLVLAISSQLMKVSNSHLFHPFSILPSDNFIITLSLCTITPSLLMY